MSDLLAHYNEELRALRELAGPFAEAHPKIAGRLRLAGDMVEDPFVGRLLEGVALLNARIAQRIDDDFAPFCESALSVLAPHLMAPVPSMAVVAFESANPSVNRQTIAAGFQIDSEAVRDHHCTFRTCYPVDIWPVQIQSARLSAAPFDAPMHASGAAAVLRISIQAQLPDLRLESLSINRLRFFISAESQRALQLHELLVGNTVGVAYAESPNEDQPLLRGPEVLQPVGFGEAEQVIAAPPGSDPASRLLLEHFTFPEKFLFFELLDLDHRLLRGAGSSLDVFIYLRRTDTALERTVSAADFTLQATPVVNLFAMECEPLRLDTSRSEQRLVADARRESAVEIHSVESVRLIRPDGQSLSCTALHAPISIDEQESPLCFGIRRQPSPLRTGGNDVLISIADRSGVPAFGRDDVLAAKALCFNRDLPSRLPFGGGRPAFYPVAGDRTLRAIRCLTKPTASLRAPAGTAAVWRLMSLLHLNHVHFSGHGKALGHFKSLLALLDVRESQQNRMMLQRLVSLKTKPSVARVPVQGHAGFCAGTELVLGFEDEVLSGSGSFLFGCVLERSFAHHAALNSFTRTGMRLISETGWWKPGIPLCGTRPLI